MKEDVSVNLQTKTRINLEVNFENTEIIFLCFLMHSAEQHVSNIYK